MQKIIDELISAYHGGDSDQVNSLLSEKFPTQDANNDVFGLHEFSLLVPRALNRDELFIEWFCRAWKDDTDTLSRILRWDDLSESDRKSIVERWVEFSRTWCGDTRLDWSVIRSSDNRSAVIARCVPHRLQYEPWIRMYKDVNEMREALKKEWYLMD